MNLLLFFATLLVSFIAVRVGAIAFQLTGMEWPMAKFQALSCFSGTGFTTHEAESITTNPRRRKIASTLMILGNAGIVTMIATFANTIRPRELSFTLPGLFRGMLPWLNLLVIAGIIYLGYHFFTRSQAGAKFTEYLRIHVKHSSLVAQVSLEELTVATGGYGVVRVELDETDPLVGKRLASSGLRDNDITVLVLQRGLDYIPNPAPDTHFHVGDNIMCFGNLDNMKRLFREKTLRNPDPDDGGTPQDPGREFEATSKRRRVFTWVSCVAMGQRVQCL